jgi:hypothetical protein
MQVGSIIVWAKELGLSVALICTYCIMCILIVFLFHRRKFRFLISSLTSPTPLGYLMFSAKINYGRVSRVRDPMRWMNFFNLPNNSSRIRPWSLLSLEQEWVPEAEKKVSGGVERGRRIWLTTSLPSLSRLSKQCGILSISQPYKPVTGIALLFTMK